jgi:hypothetical protein
MPVGTPLALKDATNAFITIPPRFSLRFRTISANMDIVADGRDKGKSFQRLSALRIALRCGGRPKGAPTARRIV